ncbi:hypothetical protein SAMN04488556_4119 [Halostagnicola kamekurae]|uniref:Uncharacterized protein n=1 Tax=Halostagnicola kamekurae TaxID=619731 RepID=A0A1I6UV73_9EURY|nr:hypothetical protein SAMN04488556_4119 [Halostagnicola kamekurae]
MVVSYRWNLLIWTIKFDNAELFAKRLLDDRWFTHILS